jgi:hypothetical protein
VTVVWRREIAGYLVENTSDRHVRLRFSTPLSSLEVVVPPRETRTIIASSFDLPFHAAFVS